MAYQLIRGDARRIPLPDGSVHCCVTSPPYWSLRNYGVSGQLGLERDPEEYVAAMVRAFREVRRVLRDDGTLWLNLGDSYASGGGTGKQSLDKLGERLGTGGGKKHSSRECGRALTPDGLKPKQLIGIPWRVALALQADGWYLRSDVIWAKPNPMPESVEDRPTKSHEYLFMMTRRERYFYDAEAVRETALNTGGNGRWGPRGDARRDAGGRRDLPTEPMGDCTSRNLRSVWTIATHAYPGAHFATFPPALVRPCIRAGTSQRGVCPACGAPWERVIESSGSPDGGFVRKPGTDLNGAHRTRPKANSQQMRAWKEAHPDRHLGWRPSCDCYGVVPLPAYPRPDDDDNDPDPAEVARIAEIRRRLLESYRPLPTIPPVVFDPFVGSGTTLEVAGSLGRRSIGLDLSGDYLKLARRRLDRPHARPVRPVRKESHPLFDHLEGGNPDGNERA